MSKSNILFLMSGSIACFKACSLLSLLVKNSHAVRICTTPSVQNFIGNATLEGLTGNKVISDSFVHGNSMEHIHLNRWADLIILCPATANTINSLASGLSSNIVGEIFLAHDFTKEFLIVPAMNEKMYQHPTTQKSMSILQDMGISITSTGNGKLACGEFGQGRMLEPEEIYQKILDFLTAKNLKKPEMHL